MTAALAILFSGALVALLGWQDPKRMRGQLHSSELGRSVTLLPAKLRGILAWLVLLPGVALAASGKWWDFLVWFGLSSALGWVVAQLLSSAPRN